MFAYTVEAHTEKPVFHLHSGNEHPSFPSRTLSDPSVPVLSLPLISPAFLSENQPRERDHFGVLYFILLKEGSTLNSDYVAQWFSQKSVGNLWTTCCSGWMHSPQYDSSVPSCSDFGWHPAHAVCYPLMYAGVSAVRPKQRQHVGMAQWPGRAKGPYAAMSPAACCLLQPSSLPVVCLAIFS